MRWASVGNDAKKHTPDAWARQPGYRFLLRFFHVNPEQRSSEIVVLEVGNLPPAQGLKTVCDARSRACAWRSANAAAAPEKKSDSIGSEDMRSRCRTGQETRVKLNPSCPLVLLMNIVHGASHLVNCEPATAASRHAPSRLCRVGGPWCNNYGSCMVKACISPPLPCNLPENS